MSKRQSHSNILPPLQERVILCLAKRGLQTKNEINSNIPKLGLAPRSHYKPTWVALDSLSQKGLVEEVGVKEYRGRKYPRFWLTDEGVLIALIQGADSNHLLALASRVYPENKILSYFLEIAPKLDPRIFRIGYSALKNKGKLEPADLIAIFVTQMETQIQHKALAETLAVLKRYPKQHRLFKEKVDKMIENLTRVKDIL